MTKKILAGVTALAVAAGTIVSGAGTADAKPALGYNPTYCVLFLPFLCLPPTATAAPKHVVHKAAMTKVKSKAKPA